MSAKADPIPHMFMAAWTALHAQGAAAMPALDLTKLQADPKALAAMAEAMKSSRAPPPRHFRFALPDNKWCKLGTGTAYLAQCDISRTVDASDNKGSAQTITETTTITTGRPSPTKP